MYMGMCVYINMGFGMRRPGFNNCCHHLLAKWCQKLHLASLSLKVHIYEDCNNFNNSQSC